MDAATIIKTLRDPMGIPFFAVVFQLLMVLTFALHIIFVNFTVGTSFLAVYGRFKGGYWPRLSAALAKAAPANVSIAMLLGIAPLLFVQVIYDPFWYASNMLSAAWVIGFILIMMAAYGFLYVFYLGSKSGKRGRTLFGVLSVCLFLLAGIIMHVLSYQLLQPDKWLAWYAKQGVDTSGLSLHAFHLPRYLHFLIPSFALTGVFLMLYAWYFKKRADMDREYLVWVGRTGAKLALFFTFLQAIAGLWWLLSLPGELVFMGNPFLLVGAGFGVLLLVLLYVAQQSPITYAVPSGLGAFVAVFAMSYAREALRMGYLGRFAYSIFQYHMNVDWGSTLLFLLTFLMGLVIISYLVSVAYQSGRAAGPYEASPSMQRLGSFSIALLLAWLVVVAGLGVVISIKNYLM